LSNDWALTVVNAWDQMINKESIFFAILIDTYKFHTYIQCFISSLWSLSSNHITKLSHHHHYSLSLSLFQGTYNHMECTQNIFLFFVEFHLFFNLSLLIRIKWKKEWMQNSKEIRRVKWRWGILFGHLMFLQVICIII